MKSDANVGALRGSGSLLKDFAALTKARIGLFVVISTLVGYVAGVGETLDVLRLIHTLLATFLVGSGASALNQYLECEFDARMQRTADRPLPAGRLHPDQAYLCGLLMLGGGIVYLVGWVNWLTAGVAALTGVIYLLFYTPLKRRTTQNTVIGAVAGALPPVGGWTAARGDLGIEALILFAIVFVWQFPHFYAIAWMYRDDYARAGYQMMSLGDSDGDRTANRVLLYSLALLPIGLMPTLAGMTGATYFYTAFVMGGVIIGAAYAFFRTRSDQQARRLMHTTLVYLPTLWVVLIFDLLP
jgi:protoheme IX farnesyltransferase